MAIGDVPTRIAYLENRVSLLETLLAPQLAEVADAQAKAAAAGVKAQQKAEADQMAADQVAADKAAADAQARQSKAAEDYLRQLLATAGKAA